MEIEKLKNNISILIDNMKIGAIMQARMGSTRLPGKIMKEINGKPLIYYSVNRIRRCKNIDTIIVATSTNSENDQIESWCKDNQILCFRGSENDVLDRYHICANKFKIDTIVRVTSDCPLIDPNIIDNMIEYYFKEKNKGVDILINTWFQGSFPSGFDVEIFNFEVLKKQNSLEKNLSKREHVMSSLTNENFNVHFYSNMNPKLISKLNFNIDYIHLSVDTAEDFIVVKKIIEDITKTIGEDFDFKDVVLYLNRSTDLLSLNISPERKKLIKNIKKM